jgi:hypothetical protein
MAPYTLGHVPLHQNLVAPPFRARDQDPDSIGMYIKLYEPFSHIYVEPFYLLIANFDTKSISLLYTIHNYILDIFLGITRKFSNIITICILRDLS